MYTIDELHLTPVYKIPTYQWECTGGLFVVLEIEPHDFMHSRESLDYWATDSANDYYWLADWFMCPCGKDNESQVGGGDAWSGSPAFDQIQA